MGYKIVSRPDCKWCVRAKAHLAVRGIDFEEISHDTPAEQLRFKTETGHSSFPQIWDGDQHIGGFDKLKLHLA